MSKGTSLGTPGRQHGDMELRAAGGSRQRQHERRGGPIGEKEGTEDHDTEGGKAPRSGRVPGFVGGRITPEAPAAGGRHGQQGHSREK